MALSISTSFTELISVGSNGISNTSNPLIYFDNAWSSYRILLPGGDTSVSSQVSRLLLMIKSGTRPTAAEFRSAFSQNYQDATNTLLFWSTTSHVSSVKNAGVIDYSATGDGTVIKTSDRNVFPIKQAVRTGTATWFAFCHMRGPSGAATASSNDLKNFVIGDVGLPGSGNDIEITDTSIIGSSESNLYGFSSDLEINLSQL